MQQYFDTLTDDSGNSLYQATVLVTTYPGNTPATIYSSNGTANPIANSTVMSDITGQVSFYAPDGVYQLTYSYQGTQYKVRVPVQILDCMGFVPLADAGAVNAMAIADPRLPAQLYVGLRVTVTVGNTNTATNPTLAINSTGAQSVTVAGGATIYPGTFSAGGDYSFIWTGASWLLLAIPAINASIIGAVFYPQTAAELAAGVTPTVFTYPPGDVRRYGALCNGVANDTVAINNALLCNGYVWITGTSVASGVKMTLDGQWLFGYGRDAGIIAANNTSPCITLSSNKQVLQNLLLSTGSLATNDTDSYTVTGITQSASAVVTISTVSASNPIAVGQWVMLQSVSGMTQINTQQPAIVTATGGSSGAWTFTLNLNSSSFSAYTSGGIAITTAFIAVQLTNTATRCLIQGIALSGVWCWGIDFEGTIYSNITYCNIDGFRKRGISLNGGGDCNVHFNMVFDSSLAAPTDAHVYMNQAAAISIHKNLITRSSATAGPGIYAVNPTTGFLGQLLWITDNTIDNGQGWAIQINGVWNSHVTGNWCAWGQNASTSYGQISLTNVDLFYVTENDCTSGSQLQGVGIAISTCNNGFVSHNAVEYNYNNVVVTNCSNMVISENVAGQLTGLPTSGVPSQNSYVESGCSAGCQVFWVNNISYQAVVAAYSGITNTVVAAAGYPNSQVVQAPGNYTPILANGGGTIYMNDTGASTLALPTNTFQNQQELTVVATQATIAVSVTFTGGALFLANGTNTSGTRTITGVGYAKVRFLSANVAIISGTGVT